MTLRSSRATIALLFAFAMLARGAVAETRATIGGRVLDSTAAALPGVTVEASPRGGGKAAVTVTGRNGGYALDVAPGLYDVSFHLLNFATTVRRGIAADDSRPATVDVTLYLAATADVVVTAKRTFRDLHDLDDPADDIAGVADAATAGVVSAAEIARRPFSRAGEILETVPGVVVSQHSGEGKANQYYLRGFNLDHGTDVAITVAGIPINLPTHAHGQGYADANFLIPELIGGVQYRKGPYSAEEGDFASAGAVNVNYLNVLDHPLALAEGGTYGFARALVADSPRLGDGYLLYAVEAAENGGPWVQPDDFRKWNGIVRYTRGGQRGGFSITAMAYGSRWRSTDQIPERAVRESLISRFGNVDPSDGGRTHRTSVEAEGQWSGASTLTQVSAFAVDYGLDLFSDFTYFLDDPVNGDQFEQLDRRQVYGARASRRWLATWGGVAAENVIGVETRVDDIGTVGLYHTRDRLRLGTIREDSVLQSNLSAYAQTSLQWSEHLRTVAGVRFDRDRFRVDASDPRNGGARTSAIVSPKLSVVLGPWRRTELYVNAGSGFHSNDARGATIRFDPSTGEPARAVDPLVRATGAEIGARTSPSPRMHLTAALWGLDLASELVFTGDAGTTEASRPSRRTGIELTGAYEVSRTLGIDADYARSRARFRDDDPAGDRIAGAVEGVASAGLTFRDLGRFSGEVRDRYFGPRPLIEDDSVRSKASNTINARLAVAITPRLRVAADVFNVFDARVSDVDYFYTSRLPGEPAGGVDDVHFHPLEKRSVRLSVRTTF